LFFENDDTEKEEERDDNNIPSTSLISFDFFRSTLAVLRGIGQVS
jgi:hypothetical protein